MLRLELQHHALMIRSVKLRTFPDFTENFRKMVVSCDPVFSLYYVPFFPSLFTCYTLEEGGSIFLEHHILSHPRKLITLILTKRRTCNLQISYNFKGLVKI